MSLDAFQYAAQRASIMPHLSKEGQVLSQRNTHYWLWFLLFGVVSALVTISQG